MLLSTTHDTTDRQGHDTILLLHSNHSSLVGNEQKRLIGFTTRVQEWRYDPVYNVYILLRITIGDQMNIEKCALEILINWRLNKLNPSVLWILYENFQYAIIFFSIK